LEGTFPFIILRKTIIAFEILIFAVMTARLTEFFLHMYSVSDKLLTLMKLGRQMAVILSHILAFGVCMCAYHACLWIIFSYTHLYVCVFEKLS